MERGKRRLEKKNGSLEEALNKGPLQGSGNATFCKINALQDTGPYFIPVA